MRTRGGRVALERIFTTSEGAAIAPQEAFFVRKETFEVGSLSRDLQPEKVLYDQK